MWSRVLALFLCAGVFIGGVACSGLPGTSTGVSPSSGGVLTTRPGESGTTGTGPAATTVTAPSGAWTQVHPAGTLPPPAVGQAMIFAASSERALLFGGYYAGSLLGDTWAYDAAANAWTQVMPNPDSPLPRQNCAMAYDAEGRQVILFGGWDGTSELDDTWCFVQKLDSWTLLEPAGERPLARDGAAMTYDEITRKVYLFGGWDGTDLFNDLWAFDPVATTWTQLSPAGAAPPARTAHCMVYDAKNGVELLFCGRTEASVDLNDLWAYDPAANTWTELEPGGSPLSVREGAGMVYDAKNLRALVFGGAIGNESFLDDTWAYYSNTNEWVELAPTGSLPPARVGPLLVYDSTDGRVLLFGGWNNTAGLNGLDDLWVFTAAP
jgi:N-acetylneuraminic acid mutarotase